MNKDELAKQFVDFFHSSNFRKKDLNVGKMGMKFILMFLHQNQDKEITAGDLAHELEVSTARIAVLLKKMEAKDYIKKEKASSDARITIVRITKHGDEKVVNHLESGMKLMSNMIDYAGLEDMNAFFATMMKIKDFLEEKGEE